MPNTPVLALPYPGLSDAPNGPAQIQALALAIDALKLPGRVVAAPQATATSGTVTSGSVETRDAILGNYTFTAVAGHRYEARVACMLLSGTVAADVYNVNVRNGGASTPTAASTLIANCIAIDNNNWVQCPIFGSFTPGAGTVTLGVFVYRTSGTGVGTPKSLNSRVRELYVVDLGISA